MRKLLVLDVVGLTGRMVDGGGAPRLAALAGRGGDSGDSSLGRQRGGFRATLGCVLPAVTCSAQATLLTGRLPSEHGIVGNGWYFRDLSEVWLWRQSNRLVQGEKVWEVARRRSGGEATCAKLFWWYNMYSSADWAVTPRPVYPADGQKLPDLHSHPAALRADLQGRLGTFPLFDFWGPKAGIGSSRWIADAAKHVLDEHSPTLGLVYLPHLDYDLQRHGPASPEAAAALADIDEVAGGLADHARGLGYDVVALSEYGITAVDTPVHLNRVLREAGYISVHAPRGLELLDAGASRAFAVADHQIAHVYIADPADLAAVRDLLSATPGIDRVLDADSKPAAGLDHPRSGELVAVAEQGCWFTYYHWLDDALAPDFARTVDIHSKPGYDPMELLLDPDQPDIKLRAVRRLIRKKLGFRSVFDVIGLDARHVRGSHGRLPDDPLDGPVYLSTTPVGAADRIEAVEVHDLILANLFRP